MFPGRASLLRGGVAWIWLYQRRLSSHNFWERAWCIILGLALIFACCCDQILLCCWVPCLHDFRGIQYSLYCYYGCLLSVRYSIPLSVATLCSSAFVGVKMALMAVARLLTRCCPLVVFATVAVDVINSSVRALRCALALRFGTWQCCGNSLADPEMRYARVSGT